jgi:hypothetical protein
MKHPKPTVVTRNIVTDFLYWKPQGGTGFPNNNIMIGVDFEIGGTYEDWGFGVYDVSYDKEKNAYTKKCLASGRTLESAIDNYIKQSMKDFITQAAKG